MIGFRLYLILPLTLVFFSFFGITQAPGNDCAGAVELILPTVEGDVYSTGLQSTCALTNNFGNANYCNNITVDGGGRDGVYKFTVTTTARYEFSLTDGNNRKTFSLHSDCDPSPANCVTSFQTGGGTFGETAVELDPGEYFIFIDRQDECCGFLCFGTCNPCRDFTLEIQIYEGNGFCNESDPFCSDSPITFPAGVNSGTAEPGPDYGCLLQQPNPAWYYLEIDQAGDVVMDIVPSPLRDIDFAIWGPFTDVENSCTAELTASCTTCPSNTVASNYPYGNLVDCSYDPQSVERATILNAQPGETYIMLITNFSNQATNISVNQVGGAGSTDCSIVIPCQVEVDAGAGGDICFGENIQLDGSFTNPEGNTTIEWSSTPADAIDDLDATDILNPTFTPSFEYGEVTFILSVTDDGPTDPCTVGDIVIINVNRLPEEPEITNDPSICSGEDAIFSIQGNADNTVTYTLDAGVTLETIQLDDQGLAEVVVSAASTDQILTISEVTNDTCVVDGLVITSTIVVNPLPNEPTIIVSSPVCEGETVEYIISGDADLEVTYTLDGGVNEETISLDATGEYVVEVVDIQQSTTLTISSVSDETCSIAPVDLEEEIVVNPLPVLTAVTTNSPICPGDDAVFDFVGDAGMELSYTLDNGVTQVIVVLDASGEFEVIIPNVVTDITLEVLVLEDENCLVNLSDEEHTIVVNDLPEEPTVSSNSPICENEDAIFEFTGEAGLSVTYTVNGGVEETIVLDAQGEGSVVVTDATENQVLEVIEIAFGTCSKSVDDLMLEVQVSPTPLAPVVSTNSPVCEGDIAIFTITGEPNETITYSIDGGVTIDVLTLGPSGTAEVPINNITENTSIEVTEVANDNCSLVVALTEEVIVNENPEEPIMTSNTPICQGENAIITIDGTPGLVVVYEVNGTQFTETIPASGEVTIEELNVLSDVSVIITSVSNGDCSIVLTSTEVVVVNSLPTLGFATQGAAYCDYETPSDIEVLLTGDAPWEITFDFNGVESIVTANTSPFSIGNDVGDYEIKSVSDANCSLSLNLSTSISIKPSPQTPVVPASVAYCIGDDIDGIEVQNPQGDVEWYLNEDLTDFVVTSNILIPEEIEGIVIYYVISNLDDCESFSSQVEVLFEICEIEIPTAITPNGDGMNDVWELNNIDQLYPNHTIKIYTRWGSLIYEHDASKQGEYMKNPWDGTFKGEILPVGSYLFVIEYNNQEGNVLNGAVTILTE